ncbi:MAG: GntR family transcriptional regulator [Verrucomicrobiae bacterium]|nr:GntR family transcriptional regulator [Verrucomicrobiae bacterium]
MNFSLNIATAEPIHLQIERFLRQQIQNSQGLPDSRLPSTKELSKQWGVSCTAIDQAMEPLVAEGLIERRRKRGTFLKAKTQQVVIGIVFGSSLANEMAHFHRALLGSLVGEIKLMKDRNWTCRVYDGLYELKTNADFESSPAFRNLANDLRNYCFKGMVMISRDPGLLDPMHTGLNLPMARLGPVLPSNTPDVLMDHHRFIRETIEWLAKRGARKIACLCTFPRQSNSRTAAEEIKDACRKQGLPEIEIHDISQTSILRSQAEGCAFDAMLNLIGQWETRAAGWPDALMVTDDVAMRGAAMALARRGGTAASKLMTAVLANEGIHHHYGMPVIRYEFSHRAIAKTLLDILWRRMSGQSLPELPVKIGGRIMEPPTNIPAGSTPRADALPAEQIPLG